MSIMTIVPKTDTQSGGRLKPYPDYKDSGVKWFGRYPAHWKAYRLKYVAAVHPSNVDKKSADGEFEVKLCNYVDAYYNDRITGDIDFMRATATEAEKQKFQLQIGDICVTKDSEEWSDIAVPAYVAENVPNLLCGYHLALVRPRAGHTDGEFLARAFSARGVNDQFRVEANGITRFALGQEALRDAFFPVPPISEQRSIAEFLDRETRRIDALVKKKGRLIELLREQRTALISHAVTQGLNPNSPKKDSGIPWLGHIPKHWECGRLKVRLKKIGQGWSPLCENRPAQEGEWGVLKVGCMNGSIYDEAENKALPIEIEPAKELEIRVGDVLMSRSNTVELVGSVGIVHKTQGKILLCDKLFRLLFDQTRLLPEYAVSLLRSPVARKQIEAASSGASPSMKNISNGAVAGLILPFPPVDEQQVILKRISEQAAERDALMAKVRMAIERLQEYRTALISAAVTGQIDVRNERTQ
jgi:type I restriction enzyme, S subunit